LRDGLASVDASPGSPAVARAIRLALANGTPLFAKKLFGNRLAQPLDAGTFFVDGGRCSDARRPLTPSLASLLVTTVGAAFIGVSPEIDATLAAVAMAGDLM
jgi:hypothetical protein